jgi:outer membrane immunogenic protein
MKTTLIAGAFAALCAVPAVAADMALKAPPVAAPAPSWAGWYLGAHVGGAWGSDPETTNDNNPVDAFTSYTQNVAGLFGGAQVGYNWQQGNIVYGLEGDLGGIGFDSTIARNNLVNVIPFQTTTKSGWYGDVTGRLGTTFGSALIYAKGGYAYFGGDAGVNTVGAAFPIPTTSASHFSGWTAGAGLEYLLTPAWSVKLEYQHFGFGNETSATTINTLCCTYTHKVAFDTAQIGLNYHLGH